MSSTEVVAPAQRTVNAVFLGLSLGVFLAALDGMIMMSALRTVADELGGLTQQAWATTSYLVTMTVSTLLYGKLSDIFGRKRLYLIAICVFTVGSLLCALAQSMYQLALFRCVQGLGAGGLFPLALAVIADMLPQPRRIRYHARLGAIFGVAGVAGPVLGGLFAGAESLLGIDGWRWVFLVNVPVGLAALVVVAVAFTVGSPRIAHRVDWWGATTLVAGIVPLLLLAEQGRDWGWSSPATLLTAGASLIGVLLFIGVERSMGEQALLSPRLFRRPAFALVNVINFLGGIGMFAGMALIPLYLQMIRGLSASAAGLLLLPQAIAMPVGALLCGPLLARTGRFTGLLAGGLAIMATCFLTLGLTESASLWQTTVLVTALGLGTGCYFQVVLTAMQNSVDRTEMGVASSLAGFSRQLGGVVGTAVTVSMLFALGAQRIASEFQLRLDSAEFAAASSAGQVEGATAELLAGVRSGEVDLDDTSVLTGLDPLLAKPFVDGLGSAFGVVFVSVGVVLSLAVLLTLLIRTRSLQAAGRG